MELKRLLKRASLRRSLQQAGVTVMQLDRPGDNREPHHHDAVELLVLRQGRLQHEIDGRSFESGAVCVDLIPPGSAHRYQPLSDDCLINNVICDPLQCPDEAIGGSLGQLVRMIAGPEARRPCSIRIGEGDELLQLLDRMVREQQADRPAWLVALRSWYRLFLIELARRMADGRHVWIGPAAAGGDAEARLSALRLAIDDHPERAWDLARIAGELGLSREQACRRFTAAFGRSPMAYVSESRLRLAQRLMRHGRSIAASAIAAGFPSRAAMHRAFVKALGCSPRAWLKGGG